MTSHYLRRDPEVHRAAGDEALDAIYPLLEQMTKEQDSTRRLEIANQIGDKLKDMRKEFVAAMMASFCLGREEGMHNAFNLAISYMTQEPLFRLGNALSHSKSSQ